MTRNHVIILELEVMTLPELEQGPSEINVKNLSVERNWSGIVFAISKRPHVTVLIRNEISGFLTLSINNS